MIGSRVGVQNVGNVGLPNKIASRSIVAVWKTFTIWTFDSHDLGINKNMFFLIIWMSQLSKMKHKIREVKSGSKNKKLQSMLYVPTY